VAIINFKNLPVLLLSSSHLSPSLFKSGNKSPHTTETPQIQGPLGAHICAGKTSYQKHFTIKIKIKIKISNSLLAMMSVSLWQ
jgi:hypothetical protein